MSKPIIKKEPITPEILHRLVSEFGHNNNLYDKRIVTMCLIGYAGFLRFSELAHIRAYDLSFQSACVSIFIEKVRPTSIERVHGCTLPKRIVLHVR